MGKVILREINIDDTDNIVKWRNLPSVRRNLYTQDELKPEQHIMYYKNIVKTGKCAQFIIVVEEEDEKKDIGTVFIKSLDYKNHNGEYGVFIGEEAFRGKGYAKAATELILKYGFTSLQLHRIYLTVMYDNYSAIAAYEKCGFRKEGVMRDEYCRMGEYIDIVMMAILEDDWNKMQN